MIFLWLACTSSPQLTEGEGDPFHSGNPIIESVDFDCDVEEAKWTFDIRTENWTGGGYIWMVKSIDNSEKHRISSKKAAADGSSDRLELILPIEPDWRDAKPDKSTRWLCSDLADLSFLATTYDASGESVRDCRTWGAEPTIWMEIDNAFDCENVIFFPLDTGEGGER